MEPKYPTYTVYRHLVLANGKSYIGQTRQNPLDRWKEGAGYVGCKYFYQAIKKYGWDNMLHIILGFAYTAAQADAMERYYIKKYKSNDPDYGYNLTSGGVGAPNRKCTEETRKKRSDAIKGRSMSEEARQKISDALKGRPSPNKGKPMSDDEKEKRRQGNKRHWANHPNPNLGKPMSEQQKKKISQANKKPIQCVETGNIYPGTPDAAESVHTKNRGNITRACKCGGVAYGFHWRYANKDDIQDN